MKRDKINNGPIIMTEEYWRSSPLSIVKYYGRIKAFGVEYVIVNKEGIDVFELSTPGSKHYKGDGMAIPEGEPCDLVRTDWIPVYRKLGRTRVIEAVKMGLSRDEAIRFYEKAEQGSLS